MKHVAETPVLFVAMPFTLIRWPSLALSLLKAVLSKSGTGCEVIYANLLYAEQVGLDTFLFAENAWSRTFLCDWLFQRRLFPDAAVSAEEFVEGYLKGKGLSAHKRLQAVQIVEAIRQRSEAFLDNLVQGIMARRPKIVGCSLTVVQIFSSLALFQQLKEQAPSIITLAGGPACEAETGMALHRQFSQIDFLFSGDADQSISPVCTALLETGRDLSADAAPTGLLTPAHRETAYPLRAPRAAFDRLDDNPLPDYTDFFSTLDRSERVKARLRPAVPFEGSRGCWWGERSLCHFCGDCGIYPKYRARSGKRVLQDLIRLNQRHKTTRFVATDNVVNPDYFESFFPKLAEMEKGYAIFFEIRSSVKREEVEAMRRAGVTYVQAGIESLHTRSLKAMNKGVQSWQNIQCLKWCRQYGISIVWFIITRFPGEDDEWNQEQAELVPLLTHLQPPRSVGTIRPDRYSPYFARARELGMDIQIKSQYSRFFKGMEAQAGKWVFHLHDRRVSDLLADPLEPLVRPGRKKLQRALFSWWQAFQAQVPAALEMRRENGRRVVVDTRPDAVMHTHVLDEPAIQILELADAAPTEERLCRMGAETGLNTRELENRIQRLSDKRLLVRRDGRIISLVLQAPCPGLPDKRDLPVGFIEGEDQIQAANPLGCDAFWNLIQDGN